MHAALPAALLASALAAASTPTLAAPAAPSPRFPAGPIRPASPEALGLKLAPGLRIAEIADGAVAPDLYALAFSPDGELVVSSRGFIRVLEDRDGDGKADHGRTLATPASGSMGLTFDVTLGADGALYERLFSFEGDGLYLRALGATVGPPRRVLAARFAEHGGHVARRGADGAVYWLGSNEAELGPGHVTDPGSPIPTPIWGSIVRLAPDVGRAEVLADGLRNPYRFDFTADGELFTFEANGERDLALPWYEPCRVFHLAPGAHHGWLMGGWKRSFTRPDSSPDVTPILARVGEGSPTGVTCYRHTQLPKRFRQGCFIADWTYGKVLYVPLARAGASYRAGAIEPLLESAGTEGFAPTDTAVGPDGALYVSIGGRGTRGAVYKIWWAPDGDGVQSGPASPAKSPPRAAPPAPAPPIAPGGELQAVLAAPQPLEAWSRKAWLPLARRLGAAAFAKAATDRARPAAERQRALEILVELFGGVRGELAAQVAGDPAPEVRGRLAWALGRAPGAGGVWTQVLGRLAADGDAWVSARALEAWSDGSGGRVGAEATAAAATGLGDADKRVRMAATVLAGGLDAPGFAALAARVEAAPLGWARVHLATARLRRHPEGRRRGLPGDASAERRTILAGLEPLLDAKAAVAPAVRLGAARALVLALGDYALDAPPHEVLATYSLAEPPARTVAAALLARMRPLYPTGKSELDHELGRLFALLEDDDASLPGKVMAQVTGQGSPVNDVHHLLVLARLRGPRSPDVTRRTAAALLDLFAKLAARREHLLNWDDRLSEALGELLRRDDRLGAALVTHPRALTLDAVGLMSALPAAEREVLARRYLPLVKGGRVALRPSLVRLLAELPPREGRALLRAHVGNLAVRDAVLLALAATPEEADRAHLAAGLGSFVPEVSERCLAALERLPIPGGDAPTRMATNGEVALELLRLLRRLFAEPSSDKLRARVVAELGRVAGRAFTVAEQGGVTRQALEARHASLFTWFNEAHPTLRARLGIEGEEDPAAFAARLGAVPWDKGDPARGEQLAAQRGCVQCHRGERTLGPALNGSAARMSREDLFTAIAYPSRDISPVYRPTVVETKRREVFTGTVAYTGPDVLILQTGPATTVRLDTADIASRRPGEASLMPMGLLEGLGPQELADLYGYLRTLK